MRISHLIKARIAACVVVAWAALLCIHLADALEDAQEEQEHIDLLVDQALATPAEQAPGISEAQPGMAVFSLFSVPIAPGIVPSALTPRAILERRLPVFIANSPGPPARADFRFFQLFSIYRL